MKIIILFFLRIFLILGFTYGGTQFLIFYFFGQSEGIFQPLFIGFGTAFFLALVFTISQIVQVKKLQPGKLTSEKLSVHQLAHMQVPFNQAQIIAKLKNNYPSKDWELQEDAGLIKLKTTFTAQSFGEKVILQINQLQNGCSEVLIESKPTVWFTLVDYGKNIKNITYLRNLLTA